MQKHVDKVNQNASPAHDVFEAIHSIMHLYRSRQLRAPVQGDATQGEEDLTHMETRVLGFFGRRPEATLSDLVAHSGRDKAQLTRLIRGLRERGLLDAFADPQDGRVTRLRLSAAGEAIHAQLHRHGALVAEAALAGFKDEERRQLLALLERVQANLDAGPAR